MVDGTTNAGALQSTGFDEYSQNVGSTSVQNQTSFAAVDPNKSTLSTFDNSSSMLNVSYGDGFKSGTIAENNNQIFGHERGANTFGVSKSDPDADQAEMEARLASLQAQSKPAKPQTQVEAEYSKIATKFEENIGFVDKNPVDFATLEKLATSAEDKKMLAEVRAHYEQALSVLDEVRGTYDVDENGKASATVDLDDADDIEDELSNLDDMASWVKPKEDWDEDDFVADDKYNATNVALLGLPEGSVAAKMPGEDPSYPALTLNQHLDLIMSRTTQIKAEISGFRNDVSGITTEE
ncbi:MAG: hypothetical protein AAGC81_11130 [Pseudomonadota bacterium]